MGGNISVHSELGVGSTFILEINNLISEKFDSSNSSLEMFEINESANHEEQLSSFKQSNSSVLYANSESEMTELENNIPTQIIMEEMINQFGNKYESVALGMYIDEIESFVKELSAYARAKELSSIELIVTGKQIGRAHV